MFNDDAQFCNVCAVSLTDQNSRSVYDDQHLKRSVKLRLKLLQQCRIVLIGIMIFAPFTLLLANFTLLDSVAKKIGVVLTLEFLSLIAIFTLKKAEFYARTITNNYAPSNYILFCIGVTLLIMSPIGLIPGAAIFWYLIKINTVNIHD